MTEIGRTKRMHKNFGINVKTKKNSPDLVLCNNLFGILHAARVFSKRNQ